MSDTEAARLATAGDPPATPPRRARRDPFWDNVRWVAIALVVVGHTIELPARNDLAFGLYLAIYAFHMPLFAFVSGRFARAERFDRREGATLIRQLVAPYLVFQVVWALFNLALTGKLTLNFLYPAWLMWFLVALAIWRLTLPIFAALRFPVTTAVLISCLAGYWLGATNLLAAPRTLTFLPFFVAGWALQQRGVLDRVLPVLRRRAVRTAAGMVLILTAVLGVVFADAARALQLRKLVQGEWDYARMEYAVWWAGGLRLAAIGAAFVLIAAALALIPRIDGAMARAGRRTMTVYLLHLLPIALLQRLDLFPDRLGNGGVLILVAVGLAWTVILSTPIVQRLADPLVSPPVDRLIARDLR